jgi:hypothetical protein
MINRLACPYSDVHLNNKPHISGGKKNRDCNCANIVKDPEMEILKIQNSEMTQEKTEKCRGRLKIYSLEDRMYKGMTKALFGASSRGKNTISGAIAIPSGKLSQFKPRTGTESDTFSSITILTNSVLSYNSNAVFNGTIKALLRPQNSKNVNKLLSTKIPSHAGKEALTTGKEALTLSSITTPKVKLSYSNKSLIGTAKASLEHQNLIRENMLHSTNIQYTDTYTSTDTDGYTVVHRKRKADILAAYSETHNAPSATCTNIPSRSYADGLIVVHRVLPADSASHSYADRFTVVHRTTDTYSDIFAQSQPSLDGSSLTSAAGGLNSASLNE